MQSIGYNALWTGASSTIVLAGSLQFLMTSFFGGGVSISAIILLSLLLNSRHMFYGLSFIQKFNSFGPASKWFLIYSLTDESYSLHCSYKQKEGINEKAAFILTSAFVVIYWVFFSVIGAYAGSLITFDTTGIDFSLTALFATILVDQMRTEKNITPVVIAVISSMVSILVFGTDSFILPSLLITIAALLVFRKLLEPTAEIQEVQE
ncbi:AzlC family ABC transporter permease [Dehalobacter sp. DCM]|nr:AzlC family ABC transporter permease [Dehalobacter sp. DCM]